MSRYKQKYTLIKRGKYWYYRTYDSNGKRTTAKTTGQTNKTLAREYCERLYLSGGLVSCNVTFAEYAAHFLDANAPYIKDRITPLTYNTLHAYKSALTVHLLPEVGKTKLIDINYTYLKRYRIKLYENFKPATIRVILFLFKEILQTAFRDGLINNNPFSMLEPMKAKSEGRDAYTREEVIQLYKDFQLPEYKPLLMLCACTGMRLSEAIGVSLSDVFEKNGFFYIHLEKQLQHGKRTALKTKNWRDIPIIPELKDNLFQVMFNLHIFYPEIVRISSSFPDYEKRQLSTHSLRHFFTTDTKAHNINPIKVEVITGHSLKGMEGVYTNFKVEDLTDILSWQSDLYKELIG